MKWKNAVGIALIILSVAAMYIWETAGREKMLLVSVAAAGSAMKAGEPVAAEKFVIMRVLPETAPEGALKGEDILAMEGKILAHNLAKGSMVTAGDFEEAESSLPKGKSIFVIPQSWMYSRSSSLRSGDRIAFYSMPDKVYLGSYEAAYVRDSAEQEVINVIGEGNLSGPKSPSSVICSIEILCSLEDYYRLYDAVSQTGPGSLLAAEEAVL